jgi:hypothetical protein
LPVVNPQWKVIFKKIFKEKKKKTTSLSGMQSFKKNTRGGHTKNSAITTMNIAI